MVIHRWYEDPYTPRGLAESDKMTRLQRSVMSDPTEFACSGNCSNQNHMYFVDYGSAVLGSHAVICPTYG